MNFRFLILDLEIESVICITDSVSCANWLIKGLHNTKSVPVPYFYWNRYQDWRSKDFDNDHIKLTDDNGPQITTLPEHLITETYLEKRKLAITRRNALITIERYLHISLLNCQDHFDPDMTNHIFFAINNSDPLKNKYDRGIEEYSEYLGISCDSAYNELLMIYQSQNRIKLRNLAMYQKYGEKINLSSDESQMKTCLNDFYKDCFINARF